MAKRWTTAAMVLILACVGCKAPRTASSELPSGQQAAHAEPIQYTSSCLANNKVWELPDDELSFTEWATSQDGSLSLRLLAPKASVEAQVPMILLAELRNNTHESVNVLPPFGHKYLAWCNLSLTGPNGSLKYTGPEFSYTLARSTFVALPSGQVHRDRIELPVFYYAGSDEPGRYTIAYPYKVVSYYQEMVAGTPYDIPDLWVGEIRSGPITIEKR